DKKLATDPDVVKNVVVAVTEEGTPITQPQVNKAYELQQKLVRQRHQTLRLLNSTPKDRAEIDGNAQIDPSTMIGEMRERLMKMKNEKDSTVDITPEK
ncbi:MAG: hypothetical protein ACOCUT_02505, partial [bacterium]